MEYKTIDIKTAYLEDIIKTLDENKKVSSYLDREIAKLKKLQETKTERKKVTSIKQNPEIIDKQNDEEMMQENEIEEEMLFYCLQMHQIEKENIKEIFPSKENYNYKKIMLRLKAECIKEISSLIEISNDEKLKAKELKEIKEDIEKYQKFILEINTSMKEEKQEEESTENKLVFIPTSGENIRVLNELSKLDKDSLKGFDLLFESIKNGTFKGAKTFAFANEKAKIVISEVKHNDKRVVFERIAKNTYVIITAFIKKSDNSTGYRNYLENCLFQYKSEKENIKSRLDDEEFIKENEMYESELYKLLEMQEKKKK